VREYKRIIETGRILYEKDLVAGFDGNISIRNGKKIYITASGVYKGNMRKEDISLIDMEGRVLRGKKPSSEYRLHLKAYRERPDVNAVVHAHPVNTTALSIAGIPMIPCLTAEAYFILGNVPTAPFALPGDVSLAESIVPFVKKSDVIILEKHGCVTFGKDLFYCLDRMEKTEALARKIWLLRGAGMNIREKVLSPLQRKNLEELRKKAGLPPVNCFCESENCGL
jgi:L-fuculose-phosphate aldolase